MEAQNPVAEKLTSAVQEVMSEIEGCDVAINKLKDECTQKVTELEAKKGSLQQKMQQAISEIQARFSITKPTTTIKRKPPAAKEEATAGNGTIPDLILRYLQDHKQAKSSEIRQFLLNQGRKSNPGVALGRLVAAKTIKNVERGIYALAH